MTTQTSGRTWLIISITLLCCVILWLTLMVPEPESAEEMETLLLPVSIIDLDAKDHQVMISASGITQARWPTNLVAAVDGRVVDLPHEVEPGALVKAGQSLVKIQSIQYQAAVDAAHSRLANARLSLEKTLHEQTVAKKSGGKLQTPYARYEPQVQSARAEVKAAYSTLENAHQRLSDTHIKAPFSAIILERKVTPSQWLQTGTATFLLAAQDSIDIKVEMAENDWSQLEDIQTGSAVTVTTGNQETWPGEIRYINPVREKSTRQRSLIVKVDNPYQPQRNSDNKDRLPLLPDSQVEITFSGTQQHQVFIAPASVLTEDGAIWTLNDADQLTLEKVELLVQNVDQVVVRFKQSPQQSRRVVLYPLGSMIEGQAVVPLTEQPLAENTPQTTADADSDVIAGDSL